MTRDKAQKAAIEEQLRFIELLTKRIREDFYKNVDKETWNWSPVANKTRLIADARRIRRELSVLIEQLKEEVRP